MNPIIFATNNLNKVAEVHSILPNGFKIITLQEAGIDIDIPEPFFTLEENAREKAQVIHQLTGRTCFAEDTGLEVIALGGEPGVKSARYAGEQRSMKQNIDKLLSKLDGIGDRSARFRTVLCLTGEELEMYFEGICEGTIIQERRGAGGFGYDPVFVPKGSDKTFAEMTLSDKNHFSHRKKAIARLTDYLKAAGTPRR